MTNSKRDYWFWLSVGALSVLAGAGLLDEGRMFLGSLFALSGLFTILSAGGRS